VKSQPLRTPFLQALLASFLLLLNLTLEAREVELVVGKETLQKMRFGMDYERLWFWNGSLNAEEKALVAKWSVIDTKIDYIRVAINSEYELTEGKLNPEAYTKRIIPMMKSMQEANPNIKFFASPRPLNEIKTLRKEAWQPYPRWITGASKNKGNFDFKWEKCAQYLERYLNLMKENGFEISFLDITNEWHDSSGRLGRLTAEDAQKISEYLKEKFPSSEMPLIVAPSSWSYAQGTQWLRTLSSGSKRKAIDIASSHNTDRTGTAKDFAKTAQRVLGKDTEVWNTELHGWKSTSKENEVTSFYYMLETIRAGFSGINGWLAIGTPKQGHAYIMNPSGTPVRGVKYFLFQKLSSTSNYGHALKIDKEPSQLSHTAALIKDGLMTVWVINKSDKDVPLKISPKGHTLSDRTVIETRWTDPKDVEGFRTELTASSNRAVSSTIPPHSVCCFEIQVN